jgi:hypothetical protein
MRLARGEFDYRDGWYHLDGRPYREFGREWFQFRRIEDPAAAAQPVK